MVVVVATLSILALATPYSKLNLLNSGEFGNRSDCLEAWW